MARLQIQIGVGLALGLLTACDKPCAVGQKPAEPAAFAGGGCSVAFQR
jgi:hypothetical protein